MHRPRIQPLLLASLLALPGAPVAAQALPDPVLPAGRVRLGLEGLFEVHRERFGRRLEGEATVDETEPLAFDLVRPSAADLFPGTADLRARLAAALDGEASAFALRLGATDATLTANRIVVPFALDVGVLDWLTVGVTVPLTKTRIEGSFTVLPDSTADLGVNPALSNLASVQGFVDALGAGAAAAGALASDRCAIDPGSQACTDAQSLADDLAGAATAFEGAFGASLLFPVGGSTAGDALQGRLSELNSRLAGLGLAPVASLVPLATGPLDDEALQGLLTDPAGPYAYLAPLGTVAGVWGLGDVEARVAVRLLEGQARDSAGAPVRWAWRVAALGTVRLPTGSGPEPDALFLPGRGDGQLDLEAGIFGSISSPRFALVGRARRTVQRSVMQVRRLAPPDVPFVPRYNRAVLSWDPGDELEIELQPAFRLTPALSLGLLWRFLSHGEDHFGGAPRAPEQQLPPTGALYGDASVLASETKQRLHEVGFDLTYRTTSLAGGGRGFEVFLDVRRGVAGSGGATPRGTTLTFGARLLRRLWGD